MTQTLVNEMRVKFHVMHYDTLMYTYMTASREKEDIEGEIVFLLLERKEIFGGGRLEKRGVINKKDFYQAICVFVTIRLH